MILCLSIVAALALVGTASPARGDSIEYSNFGMPGYTYNPNSGVKVTGNFNGNFSEADAFTATFSGTLSSVTMAFQGAAIDNAFAYALLYANDPVFNLPDSSAPIQFATSNFQVGASETYVTLSADLQAVHLVAGQQYWLAVTASNSDTFVVWSLANNGNANAAAYMGFGNSFWTDNSGAAAAFQIKAVPNVPEPASWTLLTLGLTGVTSLRHLRWRLGRGLGRASIKNVFGL